MDIRKLLDMARSNGEGFDDVLLAQLGKLGQIALDLEAIAQSGKTDEAQRLAQQLDKAKANGDGELFNSLVLQVEALAAEMRGL